MKLRNKKTGEIIDVYKGQVLLHYDNGRKTIQFKSLEELDDWEDYEEKKYWIVDDLCDKGVSEQTDIDDNIDRFDKEIGNYFETKEEAEKAVEKLKALKRLKDKGFKFVGMGGLVNEIYFEVNEPFTHIIVDEYTADKIEKEYVDDMHLLFGGEE